MTNRQIKLFVLKKIWSKSHQYLFRLPVEKRDILLECLQPCSHAIVYPKYTGSETQGIDKATEI